MSKIQEHQRSLIALLLGALLYVSFNIVASSTLGGLKLDFTQERLYTLDEGTRTLLGSLSEPIRATLYFSANLGEASAAYGSYYERVRDLLRSYEERSSGAVRVRILDPKPFSEAEDQAVAAGLSGVPINQAGENGYFGLIATNSTDGREVVPFFSLEREQFLEYDLTKLIHALSRPKKVKVGILSALPVFGGGGNPMMGGGATPWMIIEQVKEFFEVEHVDASGGAIPEGIDTLLAIYPSGMDEKALYAIDQFVLRGGNLLLFADPVSEQPSAAQIPPASDPNVLLRAWGLEMVPEKVAGDYDAGMQVRVPTDRGPTVAKYVAWLGLRSEHFESTQAMFGNLEKLNLATAGVLKRLETNTTSTTMITPLLRTGERSMELEASRLRFRPDVVGLLREFRAGGAPLMLAARVGGEAKSAFGAPPSGVQGSHLAASAKPLQVLIVADTDLLWDDLWVSKTDFLGQSLLVPIADNANFVLAALENLNGGGALASLRARGRSERPFTLVQAIASEAEQQFRAKEGELLASATALQEQIRASSAQGKANAEAKVLDAQEQQKIEEAKKELLKVRRELREVQHALRSDIAKLEGGVKILNIALVPLLLIAGAVILGFLRHKRRSKGETHA